MREVLSVEECRLRKQVRLDPRLVSFKVPVPALCTLSLTSTIFRRLVFLHSPLTKVLKASPEEKVGVMAKKGGRPSVVEYSASGQIHDIVMTCRDLN